MRNAFFQSFNIIIIIFLFFFIFLYTAFPPAFPPTFPFFVGLFRIVPVSETSYRFSVSCNLAWEVFPMCFCSP
jgi:hypothetical protein